ncbi:MAG: tyrosine-type recombinase/integrase [Candidatus Puniceispirillales bacterium]
MGDKNKKLTSRYIETINKPGKYYDSNFGLFLRVYPSGSKNWVQRITINGKRREKGLGSLKLVSLAEARDLAFENLKMIKIGDDPFYSNSQKIIPSFEEVAHKVHQSNLPSWKNKKHAAQFISTLKTYAFPHIGELKVSEVNTSHLMSILSPIWLTKAETARRVRQRISAVLTWSIAQNWRTDNPADKMIVKALPKQTKKLNHRKSMSYEDVGSFIRTVQNSNALITTKLALEFLILTATRSNEVRTAKWEEVNENLWTIPSERMKLGIAHRIPLSTRCMEIIKGARKISNGSKYIFSGIKIDAPLSENTFNKLIKDLNFDVHAHGFRTSFRTWTQEKTNYPREIAETALAHSLKDKSEAAYARSDLLEKRREMMEAWAIYINNEDAKVISIRG